jgi:hypothetical protein
LIWKGLFQKSKPDDKYLILIAARPGEGLSKADLAAFRNLRERIPRHILDAVSVVITPQSMGSRKDHRIIVAETLLNSGQPYDRLPSPAIFNAGWVGSRLKRLGEDKKAVLLIVPSNELSDIAAALTKYDPRKSVSQIRERVAQPIEPGTGIVADYPGNWAQFDPTKAKAQRYSCPLNPECIKADEPGEAIVTTRRTLGVAVFGLLAALKRPDETTHPEF